MIRYLLDTDIASCATRRYSARLDERLTELSLDNYAISAVTQAELLFGVQGFPPDHRLRMTTGRFLQGVNVLPWPVAAAGHYARIRFLLLKQTIGDCDMMIAAHALDATLVTNKTRHFKRIGVPLRLENWIET